MGSAGGVWAQPLLGRVADVWGYGPSYVVGAAISAIAVPALALSRRQNAPADTVHAFAAAGSLGAAESSEVGKEESGAHAQ
jgi:MFS family permease